MGGKNALPHRRATLEHPMRSAVGHRLTRAIFSVCFMSTAISCATDVAELTAENIRSTSQGLNIATANFDVQGARFGRHEVISAYTQGDLQTAAGKWVVAWNGDPSHAVQWARSDDRNGQTWRSYAQVTGLEFGDPGASPTHFDSSQGGATYQFSGWGGDNALAPVTDPSVNSGRNRMLIAGLVRSRPSAGAPDSLSDVAVAYSDDQGTSWQRASYLTTGNSNGADPNMPLTGPGVDNPKIASNPVSPYDTYAVWAGSKPGDAKPTGWLRRFRFNSPAFGNYFIGDTPLSMPAPAGEGVTTPDVSFIKLPSACTGGGEGVAIVWSEANVGRCPSTGTGPQNTDIKIYLAVWDPTRAGWYGPWPVYQETGTFPTCVGASSAGSAQYRTTNNAHAHIASDPNGQSLWISHTKSTSLGTRAVVEEATLGCTSGGRTAAPVFNQVVSPTPRNVTQRFDEWLPAIAFADNGSLKRTVMHWYSTREDPGQANNLTKVFEWHKDGVLGSNLWSTPQSIYIAGAAFPDAATGWRERTTQTWDYNLMGADHFGGRFLPAWGGDGRDTATVGRIETVLLF